MSKPFIYVIGPVSGRENGNRDLFEHAREKLKVCGHKVVIPHDFIDPKASWHLAMRLSVRMMMNAYGVAHLDCRPSKGSSIELGLAMDIGMKVGMVSDWLKAAHRNEDYAEEAGLAFA